MPQLQPQTVAESFLYMTARLEVTLPTGTSVGTAFFYDHFLPDGSTLKLLISNAHVIENSVSIKSRFHRLDTTETGWAASGFLDVSLPLKESEWTKHPNSAIDLAAIRLDVFQQAVPSDPIASQSLDESQIPPDLSVFDAIEDVAMIGYPSGLWDAVNNYPLLRRGTTASHPGVDFDGKPDIAIDMACFHGSSGSPIILPHSLYRTKLVPFFSPARLFAFLGVLYWGPQHKVKGRTTVPAPAPPAGAMPQPPTRVETDLSIPSNLGHVIKARGVAALAAHLASIP